MFVTADSQPGTVGQPNEDWYAATANTVVVLDGATVRTETGCKHDVPWYVRHLGPRILAALGDPDDDLPMSLAAGLRVSISQVHDLHADVCDLSHPGTPSAAVAIVQVTRAGGLRYLVLGDATILIDTPQRARTGRDPVVVTDDRIRRTAPAERAAVHELRRGDPGRQDALLEMKRAELAARNRRGGYWIAAADPGAAAHASVGRHGPGEWTRVAVLTDGAERLVVPFGHRWRELLDRADKVGAADVIRWVRFCENGDPLGSGHPRNKIHDDATLVYAALSRYPEETRRVIDPARRAAAIGSIYDGLPGLRKGVYGETTRGPVPRRSRLRPREIPRN